MRRLVAIPVRTSVVIALLLAGAAYVAAEARQAVLRRQQQELAKIESTVTPPQPTTLSQRDEIAGAATAASPAPQQIMVDAPATNDEVAAERQASQMPAQKPTTKPDGHTRQIVISIADRRLALLEDGQVVKTYPIAVGTRSTPSPEGDFQVINHAKNPTYRHSGKEIAPGKDNPLGNRWMGLSLKGYGIHGTNVPSSIGKAASHGCFRMAKADVEDLYSRVQVGDAVTIHRERDEFITQVFTPTATMDAATIGPKSTKNGELQVASATSTTNAVEAEQ